MKTLSIEVQNDLFYKLERVAKNNGLTVEDYASRALFHFAEYLRPWDLVNTDNSKQEKTE